MCCIFASVDNDSFLIRHAGRRLIYPATVAVLTDNVLEKLFKNRGLCLLLALGDIIKMSWTDERVEVLKKLWGEGKTAAEIAKELGGVTRNAVIGKAHRLKLSNRVSPIQQNKKQAAPKPAANTEKKVPPQKPANTEDYSKAKYSLLELGAGMCRWPIGDPQDKNFGFCGCSSISGLPYCAEHAKMAYQAATRNRILQAESAQTKTAKSLESEADKILKKAAG